MMVPLFSSSTELWILPLCYIERQATHSVKLCIFGLVIDMPVVVHVKVVDNPVMAQRLVSPLVQCSRPLRFPSCIPLIRCSTSLLRRSSIFSGAGRENLVEIPQLQPFRLDKAVHTLVVCNDRCPDDSEC